jgi:hypothetical protein
VAASFRTRVVRAVQVVRVVKVAQAVQVVKVAQAVRVAWVPARKVAAAAM